MSATPSIFHLALFIAVPITVTLAVASDHREHEVVVVSIAGDWKYEDARVTFGQSLAAKGCLYGSDGSVVLQSDEKGASPHPFVCEKPSRDSGCQGHNSDRCAVPLDPGKWKPTGGSWGNFWEAVKQLFTGDPEKYMVAASRGIEPGLEDAVVPLQGHNLDLAPAFRELGAGWYGITSSPVAASKTTNSTFELRFVPHNPAVVSAPAIQPGLYRLTLVDKTGAPAGSDCWVLISSPENYSSASDAFQRAVEKSAKWPEDMDPSAVRALLRAYLESLSISGAKSKP